MPRSKRPGFGSWRSSLLHIIGVKVSATKPETITAPASVSANSTNSRPVRPGVNASGANTAASVSVIATTAKPISLTPFNAAWNGARPSSMWRKIFSTTTIASSTTSPIASTSASNVNVLTLKPASAISANAPIRLTGIVTSGMIDARNVRRNTKTTSATRIVASVTVRYTDFTDRSMNTALSLATCTFSPAGRSCWRRGIISRTPFDTSSGFAVALRMMPVEIDGTPFNRTLVRSLAAACSMRATSRSRTV